VGVSATCLASGWQVRGCCQPADFNAGTLYNLGTIDGQQGWTASPPAANWDQTIKIVSGRKVWQLSNVVASGNFGNQPTSYSSCQVAGEPNSNLWDNNNPPFPTAFATSNTFYWRVQFQSAVNGPQTGLQINMAAAARQTAWRMTNLRIVDNGAGLEVHAYEATVDVTTPPGTASYPDNIIATLSYGAVHTLETEIAFVPGITITGNIVKGNDIVKVYVDGALTYTGNTWEALYYTGVDVGVPSPPSRLQAVNSLQFRLRDASGAGVTAGNGLYFQEVLVGNSRG
jgi:hypothetical protein